MFQMWTKRTYCPKLPIKKNQSLEIEEDIKTQIINFIPTDFESSYQNLRKKFKEQKNRIF